MGTCYSTADAARRTGASYGPEEQEVGPSRSASARPKWWKPGRKSRAAGIPFDRREEIQDELPVNGVVRLWMNGANAIGDACLYTQQGKKGVNQDAMIVWENFSSTDGSIFCGVFDGHGPFGHMVSKKVRDSLPLLLYNLWTLNPPGGNGIVNTSQSLPTEELKNSLNGEENGKLPEMYSSLQDAILRAFKQMDEELKFHPSIDCFCSGTTAVTLIKQGDDLVIGNVGDSRAVLASRDENNSLIAVQLTVDLKPDLPKEAERIQHCKGRVFALLDEPEVARVWLPNADSPGLAMARAFGDFCLKDFGLISIPEIYYRKIKARDEFIILATDGVWDVLSNEEAIQIVASAPTRPTAARALVDCAVRAWRLKYPTSKNDDCAVVCLFLDHSSYSAGDAQQCSFPNDDNPSADRREICNSEIVPVIEAREGKALPISHMKPTLAECMSTAEDEEWLGLDGITRVNSLVSLPRFVSWKKRQPR